MAESGQVCERYRISDKFGPAIANSAFQEVGIADENNKVKNIDKARLQRERKKILQYY